MLVVRRATLELAHLVEAARIGQQINPLPHRELALRMLPLNPRRTAHRLLQRVPTRQFLDLLLPAHGRLLRCKAPSMNLQGSDA